jgi:hypothetical protein
VGILSINGKVVAQSDMTGLGAAISVSESFAIGCDEGSTVTAEYNGDGKLDDNVIRNVVFSVQPDVH